jgi:hypothetical protein
MKGTKRLASMVVIAVLTLGLMAPAASAQSCTAQAVEAERELFGTGFGREIVSFFARNPDAVGFSNFGQFVRFLATSDPDACPVEE